MINRRETSKSEESIFSVIGLFRSTLNIARSSVADAGSKLQVLPIDEERNF